MTQKIAILDFLSVILARTRGDGTALCIVRATPGMIMTCDMTCASWRDGAAELFILIELTSR